MDKPILYIIVRNDLKHSLNPGKAMAQVSHAVSQFVANCFKRKSNLHLSWLEEANNFGTTIVLEADKYQLNNLYQHFGLEKRLTYGIVEDPTYPFKYPKELDSFLDNSQFTYYEDSIEDANGFIFATRNEVTCHWLFLDKEDKIEEFKNFCKEHDIKLAK